MVQILYDDAVDVAIGDSGAVYIVGSSGGSWNGPDGEEPLHSFSGVADITVLKLDDFGAYQWHTFYGSNMGESSTGITLDNTDDVYINSYGNTTWNGPDGQEPLHSYENR